MNRVKIICKIPYEMALQGDFLNKLIKKIERQVKGIRNSPHMIIEITWGQQNEEKKKVTYLCDGRHCCNNSENCCVNGGECHHTKDIKHAKHFREWSNTYEEVLPDMTGQHHT